MSDVSGASPDNAPAANRRKRRSVPPPPKQTPIVDDVKATAEAEAIAAGNLGKRKKISAFERSERFKDMIAHGVHVVFWIALCGIVIAGVCWFYHLVTPECYHFLSDKQVDKLTTLLFGGALTTFVSDYAKTQLK